jgi:intracellular septation protein
MEERTAPTLLSGLKRMAVDILAGWLFLAVFLTTNNIYWATACGLLTGIVQMIWMITRRQRIDPMQWMAMVLVVGLGAATILTHNPTFVVFKPSIFDACLGAMMLRPGWIGRYSPSQVSDLIPPRVTIIWGYLWAFSWFALAGSNLVVEHLYGLKVWALWTNFSPIALVAGLTGAGMLVFPPMVRRAARARGIRFTQPPAEA